MGVKIKRYGEAAAGLFLPRLYVVYCFLFGADESPRFCKFP